MNIKETIRAEIERLKKENDGIRCKANGAYCVSYDDAFYDLLAFLDTLPEQLEVDLEKEIEERAGQVSCCDFCHEDDYIEREEWCKKQFHYFYDLGCRHVAVMYDDIEYERQRAEEAEITKGLEEELKRYINSDEYINTRESGYLPVARHFAEWGAEHLKKYAEF